MFREEESQSGALWGHAERGRGLRLRCMSGPVASVRRYRQGKVLGMKSYCVGKPLEHFMEKEKKKWYDRIMSEIILVSLWVVEPHGGKSEGRKVS